MSKDKNSFFDSLIEDFCKMIEIKGVVEAGRDENGKLDKWASAGIAVGLGTTSDDEISTLAGFLGAEGAFDDDCLTESNTSIEDTFIGTNLVSADDMKLLSEAGFDELDLELMESYELKEAMEEAGVDTFLYDFD